MLTAHLIFVVKYRRKLLSYFGSDVKDLIFKIADKYCWDILEYNDDLDHIHIFISYNPKYSILDIVRLFKQITTYYLWRNGDNEKILKKFFWKEQTFWSDGYFACSVGDANPETVRKYIREQG